MKITFILLILIPVFAMGQQDSSQYISLYSKDGTIVKVLKEEYKKGALPTILKTAWDDPDALYGMIVDALQNGLYSEVIEAANHLLAIDSNFARSYNCLGVVYLKNNMLAEAEKILTEGISKSDYKASIMLNLVKVYKAQGKIDEEKDMLWEVLLLDPNIENGLTWYVACEREKGGEEARMAAYNKVASISGSWRAQLFIARHYLEQGRLNEAKELYKEILRVSANNNDAIYQITGDLGLNHHVDVIFELIYSTFKVSNNNLKASVNIITACIEAKRKKRRDKIS